MHSIKAGGWLSAGPAIVTAIALLMWIPGLGGCASTQPREHHEHSAVIVSSEVRAPAPVNYADPNIVDAQLDIVFVAENSSPPSADPVRRKRLGPPRIHPGPRTIQNYTPQPPLEEEIDWGSDAGFGFEAVPGTGWVPPDADLAVGLHHIVTIVNGQLAVFDRNGNVQWRRNLAGAMGFWVTLGAGGWLFDPEAHYDEHSHRFWVIACEQTGSASYYNLAVSATHDPTGDWYKYRINVTALAGRDIDSPNLAIGPDTLALSADFSETGDRMLISIFPKAPFLSGSPTPIGKHILVPGLRAAGLPSPAFGSPAQYMIEARLSEPLANTITLHAIRDGLTLPVHSSIAIEVPPYLQPGFPPQPGTQVSPDLYDARFWSSIHRRGSIWATHNVRTPETGDRTIVRWYEIRTGNWPLEGLPYLAQWGEIDEGPGIHTFCPSIAADHHGNAAVSYSRSSEHEYIAPWRAIRLASDPPGTMNNRAMVRPSTASFTIMPRWGDYSATVVDPVNPCTFWSHQQFTTSPNDWRTWVARYSFRPDADLDGNCRVDIMDFVRMQQWFSTGDPRADLDGNGRLDVNDFMLFLSRAAVSQKP